MKKIFERGWTGKSPNTVVSSPVKEEEKKGSSSRSGSIGSGAKIVTTVNTSMIPRDVLFRKFGYVSNQPPSIIELNKKQKPAEVKSRFNPITILRDPRKYFEERLPAKKEPSFDFISKNIPYTRGGKLGYRTISPGLPEEISFIGGKISEGKSNLRSAQIFMYDYPKYKSQFESSMNVISSAKPAPPGSFYWIDINANRIREENELSTDPIFSFKGESKIYTKEEALSKVRSEWSKVESSYTELKSGGYNRLKVDIKKLGIAQFSLGEYQRKGWKFEKTKEGGYLFTEPSAEEIHGFLYPGAAGSVRLGAVAAMESFPTIVPIRSMIAGIGSAFTGGKSWRQYEHSLYESSVNLTMRPEERGVNVGSYAARFWSPTSESGVGMNIYLPAATMGFSYVFSGLTSGVVSGGSKTVNWLSKAGQTLPGQLTATGIKTSMYTLGGAGIVMTGISLGATAARRPEDLWGSLGYTIQGVGQAVGGWTLGSYLHGGGMPKLMKDSFGNNIASTKTFYEDVMVQMGEGGKFKFIRMGETQTTFFGEKAGTGVTTRSTFRLKGQGQFIGGESVATRISGISWKSQGDIFGSRISYKQFTKLFKAGKANIVEGGGISTRISSNVKGFTKTVDIGRSASLGKSPNVITSRGQSIFKELSTNKIPITETKIGNVKVNIKGANLPEIELTKSLGVSMGSFEGAGIKGIYYDVGITNLLKGGFKTPGEIMGGGGSKNIILGESAGGSGVLGSIKTVTMRSEGGVKTVNPWKAAQVGKGEAVNIGSVETGGGATAQILNLPVSKQVEAAGSKAVNVSKINLEAPKSFMGNLGLGSIIETKQEKIQRRRSDNILIQKSKINLGGKNVFINIHEPIVENNLRRSGLNIVGNLNIQENKNLQISRMSRSSMMKMRQLRILNTISLSETKTIQEVVRIPAFNFGFIPTPIPPIPKNQGREMELGSKRWRRSSFGLGSGKISLKRVLSDPFSVMTSQQKFGKATHPLPTRNVWIEAEKKGWRLGTVEMRKVKKSKIRFKKKRKR